MSLVGTEVLYVNPLQANGQLGATLQQTTVNAIAALAAVGVYPSTVNTNITTAGAGTLTAAAIVGGLITRSGPIAAFSDATDTAVAIVAALAAYVASESFYVEVVNTTAFAQTITAGSGITLTGAAIIPPNSVGRYLVTIVSPTAVTLRHVETGPRTTKTLEVITALTTAGAGTITAAGIAGGITARTGATSAFSDTTDTADNIIAAQPNVHVGDSWEYIYQNSTVAAATIGGGTGVTVSGITVVPPGASVRYLVTYTATSTITMVGVTMARATSQVIAPIGVGSSKTLTAANSGAPILLDTVGGSTATLPAATGSGNTYRFYVTATTTSAAHKILAASVSDFINGIAMGFTGSTAKVFASAAATNHSVQMPFAGSQPSGGFIGDWFEFVDVAANLWTVTAQYQAGTTPTTPFSSATS